MMTFCFTATLSNRSDAVQVPHPPRSSARALTMSHRLRIPAALLVCWFLSVPARAQPAPQPVPLPGTQPLTFAQPLYEVMVSGIDKFALRAIEGSAKDRDALWKCDYSSLEAYEKSVAPHR